MNETASPSTKLGRVDRWFRFAVKSSAGREMDAGADVHAHAHTDM